ncbi:MAG: sigma-54 dependent transcriptional regulator [Gemmatimonadetes bacterium]|nr:sigma-54 dependent transcriptional regulator [Gemmatimonadota bacterium]MDA1103774.1 sigma-54 dependent transcriptional regulator [Gemmatimonadota bacterium]
MKILIIDDDAGLRKSLSLILGDAGYEVVQAEDGEQGLATAREQSPDVILCDVRMPKLGGLEFLEAYRSEGGTALILVMTAYGGLDLAMEAMKKGAYDYIPKPFGSDDVLLIVRKAEEREQLRREVGRLRQEVRADARFGEIVVGSPAMREATDVVRKVAPYSSSVLITGSSGTGKELVARMLHRESSRADQAFIPVNCGGVPEQLLESEFFGFLRGAFTGADRDKEGLFEAAHRGTLFLDEVGELPGALQVKMLRALQEGEVRRIGATSMTQVDVRIIAATNRDLEDAVEKGEFRKDLYYRLAVVPIHLPQLRSRREEIPQLANHLLLRHSARLGVHVDGIDPAAMEVLLAYAWPGNIRELENVLERALVLTESKTICLDDLPEAVRRPAPDGPGLSVDGDDLSVKKHGARLERHLIQLALDRTGGNKTQAADLLELSPRALRYKIQEYGIG